MIIKKQPAKAFLTDNPVVFGVKTSNAFVQIGSRARLILYFGQVDYSGTGHGFSLTFLHNTYTFVCAAVPDDSGLQYPLPTSTDNNLTWMSKIADALGSHYIVSSNYDISYTYNRVTLIAKQEGSVYNLSASVLSVPNMSVTLTAGIDSVPRPFFNMYAAVIFDGKKIGEDLIPVDELGMAYFDFSEYLRGRINASFVHPEISGARIIQHSEAVKPVVIRYGEYYGEGSSAPSIHRVRSTSDFFALPGGVSAMTQALYNEYGSTFYQQLQYTHQFLTWRPLSRKTAVNEIQKLWYFLHTECSTLNLMVGLNYADTDGVVHTTVYTKASLVSKINHMYEICCGYKILGLDIDCSLLSAGSQVLSYDVFLKDQSGTIISEIRHFEIDTRAYLNPRTFIFKNSFGVWETFTATGDQVKEAQYESVMVDRYRNWNFNKSTPDSKKHSVAETQKMIVNSGWLTKDECDWMRELQLSKEVYEIINGLLYPAIITGSKIGIHKDNEYLYNVEIEYSHAFVDEHYSNPKLVKKIDIPFAPIADISMQSMNNAGTITIAPTMYIKPMLANNEDPILDPIEIRH